jgi:para-nitrobenzyl esterase
MDVDRDRHRRVGSSLWILGCVLAPALLQGQTLTCAKTGDTTLSVLELEVGGVNWVTPFAPDERSYHVWTPGGPAILRADPTDPASKVTYQYASASGSTGGLIGVGGGEITLDIAQDLSTLWVYVRAPGGASDSYIVDIQIGSGPEPLDLTPTDPPVALGSIEATYYESVPYGPYDENLFDIYLPTSETPTPLLLYIHGGGFTGGSRDTTGSADRVLSYLVEGVAYASIDYRLLHDFDPDGVIKPLSDSTRCLQFIRYHAVQLNIDPDRIILMGGSAGAGTSLWIGFNDDLADYANDDPVLRQSTRVTAIVAISTQATYDLGKWSTVVFAEFNLDVIAMADQLGLLQRLLDFYGITDVEDFDSPETLAYRAAVDMLALMDPEDPPFYVQNDLEPATMPLTVNLMYHHANHALALAEQADEISLENVAYIKALGIADPSGDDSVEFSLRHFGL